MPTRTPSPAGRGHGHKPHPQSQGCYVYQDTILGWIIKFTGMVHAYLQTLPIQTGERFCADEVVGVGGHHSCLFSVTDLQIRFCLAHQIADHKDDHNATTLLKEAKGRAGKIPAEFVSDGRPSYAQAHQTVFAAKTPLDKCSVHMGEAAIRNKKRNNNVQERFNGTFRALQRPGAASRVPARRSSWDSLSIILSGHTWPCRDIHRPRKPVSSSMDLIDGRR